MVWSGEVEAHTGFVFDVAVGVEFGAIVGGHGFHLSRLAIDEFNDFSIQFGGGARAELADDDVFGLSLDHGDDAVAVIGADDGIGFPVAEAGAVLSAWRALRDVALIREDPAGIGASVAFSASFRSLAEMEVEAPAVAAIVPDVSVDGLMADVEYAVEAQPAGDLLRAPVETQQGDDHLEVLVGETPVAPGVGAPAAGAAIGLAGAVVAIVTVIAADLPGNGAAVAAELPGDGGLRESLHAQSGDHIPLSGGDLEIAHRKIPLLAG